MSLIPQYLSVGIDCLALPKNFSGAAYYIYYLTREMLQAPRSFTLTVFCKPPHQKLFASLLQSQDRMVAVPINNRAELLYFYEYKLGSLLKKKNLSLFYATHYLCPRSSPHYRIINTFHDMGFLLYPEFYRFIKRLYFGSRMKTFLWRTDTIITVSHSTARAIRRLFPEQAQKLSVIYPGTDHLNVQELIPQFPRKMRKPFILAVNTLEKRKNIAFSIKVFNCLREHYHFQHQLVLVGPPANAQKEVRRAIQESPYRSNILLFNSISREQLVACYRNCDFFLNASAYEGFGFTPLEAIQHDCPVFLYRNNTVAELLGAHPYMFDDYAVERWAALIAREAERGFMNRISKHVIQHLSWQNTIHKTIHLIEHMLYTREIRLVS